MTEPKQNFSDIVVHLKAAQHELEEAEYLADVITGNSFVDGAVTACRELCQIVLKRVESEAKSKENEE